VLYVDEARVASARSGVPGPDALRSVADLFGLLSDETRLRILYALAREELCVCDLARVAGRSIPAVSHQLAALRRVQVVSYRSEGKLAYYRLASQAVRRLLRDASRRSDARAAALASAWAHP
jgi:ArsR family transcriptional regulator